jgi:hypothetical protein
MKNEAKLKQWGLAGKERYYYLKFFQDSKEVGGRPHGVATVCLIGQDSVEGWHYVRGVAFCSPKDQFVKKTGRAIALGRAVRAIEKRSFNDPIHKTTPAVILAEQFGWAYLSQWNVSLTEYELNPFKEAKHEKALPSEGQ